MDVYIFKIIYCDIYIYINIYCSSVCPTRFQWPGFRCRGWQQKPSHFRFLFEKHHTPWKIQHGTYKSPIWKGKWSSKPPWLWSMLIFQGVHPGRFNMEPWNQVALEDFPFYRDARILRFAWCSSSGGVHPSRLYISIPSWSFRGGKVSGTKRPDHSVFLWVNFHWKKTEVESPFESKNSRLW